MQGVRFDPKPSQDEEKEKKRRKTVKLEFMFMKHYAPNRCEPSIEALNFRGGGEGGSGLM